MDDSFALAKAGELDYEYAFNLTKILVNETEYVAWSSVMKRLKELQKFLKPNPEIYTKYQVDILPVFLLLIKLLFFVCRRTSILL